MDKAQLRKELQTLGARTKNPVFLEAAQGIGHTPLTKDLVHTIQAEIHKRIKELLTKRQQGNVMEHVRAVLLENLRNDD